MSGVAAQPDAVVAVNFMLSVFSVCWFSAGRLDDEKVRSVPAATADKITYLKEIVT